MEHDDLMEMETPSEQPKVHGFCKFHNWLEKDSTRWVMLFVVVIPLYIWMMVKAFIGKMSDKNAQDKDIAYLFGRGGGYNKIRGDPNSPSLFKWSAGQISYLLFIFVLTCLQFWWIVIGIDVGKKRHFGAVKECDSIWVRLSKFFIIWVHTTLLLFLVPINPFHKRINYNARAAAISVVNDPAKELLLAFAFIVLLPLPHSQEKSAADKFTWLGAKLGLFYVFQNIMLGRPHYKLKSTSKDDGWGITKKGAYVYLLVIILIVIYWAASKYIFPRLKERCKPPKPIPCPPLDREQGVQLVNMHGQVVSQTGGKRVVNMHGQVV
jgi:hypothetical protein